MVIFLVGLVSMILMRTLRKDYARYSKDDDLDDMVRLPFVTNHVCVMIHVSLMYNGFARICLFMNKDIFKALLQQFNPIKLEIKIKSEFYNTPVSSVVCRIIATTPYIC